MGFLYDVHNRLDGHLYRVDYFRGMSVLLVYRQDERKAQCH